MARPFKHDVSTRAALLDAAERLLADGGPDAVSVRSVADVVGVSTRAVYSVFGSKQALVDAMARRGLGVLADLVEAVPATHDPAADLVQVGVKGFREFAVGRPHLFRVTFDGVREDVLQRPDVNPELQRAFAALGTRVARVIGASTTDRRTIEVAFMFHSLCHGLAANELSRNPPPVGAGLWKMTEGFDLEAIWTTALGAFVSGVAERASFS